MTPIQVLNTLPQGFLDVLGGLFFLAMIGKFTRAELRLTLLALAGVVVYQNAAVFYAVGILGLFIRIFGFVFLPLEGKQT